MKRFYLVCPTCGKTAMSGLDIYEHRSLKCTCGNVIQFNLENLVLKECDGCGKNLAFQISGGRTQSCFLCGKSHTVIPPAKMLEGDDSSNYQQMETLLNKGLMTRTKLAKAKNLFENINNKGNLSAYENHINNYNDYIMYESEYNSAVRIMNETLKKLDGALQYHVKEELDEAEKILSQTAIRFTRLGSFKKSSEYKKQCEEKASVCHSAKSNPDFAVQPPAKTPSQNTSVPESRKKSAPPPQKSSYNSYKTYYNPSYSKSRKSPKKLIISVAAVFAVLSVGLIVFFVFGNQKDESGNGPAFLFLPSGSTTENSDNSNTSVSDENNTEDESGLESIYQEFQKMMDENNYDLYTLNMYTDNLKGYKDADSIFEAHKDGFYNTFSTSAKSYTSSTSYDVFATVEALDGLSKLNSYKDSDVLIRSVIDKNMKYVRRYESMKDYMNAGTVLLEMSDYLSYYNGSENPASAIYDIAVILSEKDRSNDERLLAADLFGTIPDYKDAAKLKDKLEN